jgi:hypothetical protein
MNATIDEIDEVEELLGDVRMGTFLDANIGESSAAKGSTTDNHEQRTSFDRLCVDGLRKLYPGCKKISKISFILKMLHIKAICNMSNKAFDMMIDLIKGALPDGETLPRSYRKATQFTRDLGIGYELIRACKNDCVLFWKEHADKDKCPNCTPVTCISCCNNSSLNNSLGSNLCSSVPSNNSHFRRHTWPLGSHLQ